MSVKSVDSCFGKGMNQIGINLGQVIGLHVPPELPGCRVLRRSNRAPGRHSRHRLPAIFVGISGSSKAAAESIIRVSGRRKPRAAPAVWMPVAIIPCLNRMELISAPASRTLVELSKWALPWISRIPRLLARPTRPSASRIDDLLFPSQS